MPARSGLTRAVRGAAAGGSGFPVGYVGLMGSGAALAFAKVFLLGRLLERTEFGQYAYLTVIIQYAAPVVGLGILEGLSRRLPLLVGAGREAEARQLRNTCLGALALVAAVAVAGTGMVAATIELWTGRSLTALSVLVALEIAGLLAFSTGLRDIRSHLRLRSYATLMFLRSALDVAAVAAAAPRFGVLGVLAAEAGVLVVLSVLVFGRMVDRPRIAVGVRAELGALIKEGLLILAAGVLANTALLGDRLVLGAVLSSREYAVYAVHALVVNAALVASNVVQQYVAPHVLVLYGREGSCVAMLRWLTRTALGLLVLGTVGGVAWPAVFSWLAGQFFPGYPLSGVLVMLLYVGAVLEVANVFPVALVARGELGIQVWINLVIVVVLFGALAGVLGHTSSLIPCGAVFLGGRLLALVASYLVARRYAVTAEPSDGRCVIAAARR